MIIIRRKRCLRRCRCEISFIIFCLFHHIVKLLYTSLNLLPWKQNSLVILFLQYLLLKGIMLPKSIIYFVSAYYAQGSTDSDDDIAKFTEFPKLKKAENGQIFKLPLPWQQ